MRKICLFVAIVVAFASCEKVKELTHINTNIIYKESVDIPELPGGIDTLPPMGITAYFPGKGIPTNSAQYMKDYKTSGDLINFVKLSKLTASMLDPQSGNFDFVDTLQVFLKADGLEEKLVAYKYGIPKGQSTVDLDRADVDLKQYFLKDTMFLRFGGHFVSVPDSASKVELNTTFNLDANPLN